MPTAPAVRGRTGWVVGASVLLAGGTGALGRRVGHHLLGLPGTSLRLLVRRDGARQPDRRAALQRLREGGAEVVEGELGDAASLALAARGVDVVVSALQGGHDVVVEGQVALAEAAAASGARRFLPSDFALDLFRATPGEHAGYDLRREADERIAGTGLQHVHVLGGASMERLLGGHLGWIDHGARTATWWGTGEEAFEATSLEDTARVAARVALDPAVCSGTFAVAAEQVSLGRVVDAAEEVTGHTYRRRSLGSVEDLRATVVGAMEAGATPQDVVVDVHLLYMLTGQTALRDLQNHRYPDLRWRTLADVARTELA